VKLKYQEREVEKDPKNEIYNSKNNITTLLKYQTW